MIQPIMDIPSPETPHASHPAGHHPLLHWPELAHEMGDLLTKKLFVKKLTRILSLFTGLGILSIGIGAAGFRFTEGLCWLDCCYWATMLLTGCGLPQIPLHSSAKVWSMLYAFYGEAYFAGVIVGLLAPIAQNLLRRYIQRSAPFPRTSPPNEKRRVEPSVTHPISTS